MMMMIRTELYKLRTSFRFKRHLLIFSGLNLGILTLILAFFDKLLSMANEKPQVLIVTVEEALSRPFTFSLMMVFMYMSAVTFFYTDFQNGYVKNIAGQIKSKDTYVIAKLIAVGVHNLIFCIAGSATYLLSGVFTGRFEVGEDIPAGVATLLIEWLLSVALCSILLLFSVGFKNHTLSVIFGVVFSTNALSLVYTGINYGVHELFKANDFDIRAFSPSSLIETVSVAKGDYVINALIVSAVMIAVFVYLSCWVFKKRDIH